MYTNKFDFFFFFISFRVPKSICSIIIEEFVSITDDDRGIVRPTPTTPVYTPRMTCDRAGSFMFFFLFFFRYPVYRPIHERKCGRVNCFRVVRWWEDEKCVFENLRKSSRSVRSKGYNKSFVNY